MKLFGNLTELLSLAFRKGGKTVVIQPATTPSDNETFTLPDIAAGSGPTSDTLVGAAASQTLTNKTLTAPTILGGTINAVTAANVAAGANLANAATDANTPSQIVKRDAVGNFSAGTVTANLTGNASGTAGGLSGSSLTGDVTNSGNATTVATVGGSSAANVHSAELLANAATNANTASAIVKRDASGNFSAGTITAALSGNATTATTAGSTGTFTGSFSGDVTGGQASTVVATVGGSSAANVHSAELAANAATNVNTASQIVKRDASGNFAAGTITANLTGTASNATTSVSFSGSLGGDVTGTQSSTVVGSVGGSTAANVHAAELAANAATSAATNSTIVKRDASGNFSAGTITATLNGNASSASTLSGTVAIANGGTGQTTQQAAINALAGTQSSGKYLRSDGTNTSLASIQAADVPTLNQNTSGTAAGLTGTSLTGDVSNSGNTVTVNQVKGGVIPVSKTIVGTNASGQIVDATSATLTNNTSGTAANVTATSNSTLTTLSALSLPGSQVSGNISGNAANVTGTVAVGNGGTGATTAPTARTNLGAAASGANSDITSLTGLTTALSVAQGGTGVTSSTGTGAGVHSSGPTLTTPQINSALLIQEIATPANPGAGFDKLYTKSDGILYKLDSSGNEVPVGSGTGSGEINAVLNPSAATNTTGWTAATNYSVAKDTSNSPLSPVTSTSLSMLTTTASTESSTSGIYYSIATLPSGLTNKKLKVEFYVTTPASSAGTWKVSVYAGSTRLSLTTDASGSTTLPAGFTGKFVAYFDATNATAYSVNFTQTARTSANTMYVTNVIVGPGIQPQGAVVSAWQAYTPTIAGVTTSANVAQYRRVGDSVEIEGSFTASGTSTALVTASLPSGLTINTSALAKGGTADDTVGNGIYSAATITQIYVTYGGSNTVSFGGQGNTARYGATVTVASPNAIDYRCIVPVNEWAGSGTVQLAQNDVEYAYNTSTTDADDTSSFGYGPGGTSFPTITAQRAKRIRFQTPIQVGDTFSIEIFKNGDWIPLATTAAITLTQPFMLQNTTTYGMAVDPVNATDVDVYFGAYRLSSGATYGAVGTSWSGLSTVYKWRVRKSSAGAAVGFGIVVPGTSSGLVSSAGLPGNTTGNDIATGYVGEIVSATLTDVPLTSATAANGGTLTLQPGIWTIYYKGTVDAGAFASYTSTFCSISTTSASHDSTNRVLEFSTYTAAEHSPGTCVKTIKVTTANYPVYGVVTGTFVATLPVSKASKSQLYAVRIA